MFRGDWNTSIPVDQLNIFIGKNNAGKTKLLEAIARLFSYSGLDGYFHSEKIMPWLYQSVEETPAAESPTLPRRIGRPLTRTDYPVEAFFEFPSMFPSIDFDGRQGRERLTSSPTNWIKQGATREGYLNADTSSVVDREWLVALLEWLSTATSESEAEQGNSLTRSRMRDRTSLSPLRGLIAIAKTHDHDVIDFVLKRFESSLYFVMRDSSGSGALYIRVPRSDVFELANFIGAPVEALEETLGPIGIYKGVRDFPVTVLGATNFSGHGSFIGERHMGMNPPSNPVEELYQWDDDVLVAVADVTDSRFVFDLATTFVPDSTVNVDFDIERIVIEFAEVVGREINDRNSHPVIDWMYRSGEATEDAPMTSPLRLPPSKDEARLFNFKLHPAVCVACRMISEHVNLNLPDFISQQYEFVLEPLTPPYWTERRRLSFGLRRRRDEISEIQDELNRNLVRDLLGIEVEGSSEGLGQTSKGQSEKVLPLESFGAGIRRWVKVVISMISNSANSLLIDASELEDEFIRRLEDTEILDELVTNEYFWGMWQLFCESPEGATLVKFDGIREGGILLIDEPEAALHPEGVDSIRRWLENQAVTFGSVFVATHNLKIFDSDFTSVGRFALRLIRDRAINNFGIFSAPTSGYLRLLEAVDEGMPGFHDWALEMGFTRGEFLMMTRYFLFVEGPHDEILLREFFGDSLSRNGVRVIPLHGLDRAKSLADAELISELNIPFGVLADNLESDRKSYESSQINRLIREVELKGREVDIFGLSASDILDYLPYEVVSKRCSKEFNGWSEARLAYSSLQQKKGEKKLGFKSWVQQEYGLSLTREDIQVMAYETAVRGLIPNEMVEVIDSVISRARLGI